jgi:hypothetical protein
VEADVQALRRWMCGVLTTEGGMLPTFRSAKGSHAQNRIACWTVGTRSVTLATATTTSAANSVSRVSLDSLATPDTDWKAMWWGLVSQTAHGVGVNRTASVSVILLNSSRSVDGCSRIYERVFARIFNLGCNIVTGGADQTGTAKPGAWFGGVTSLLGDLTTPNEACKI